MRAVLRIAYWVALVISFMAGGTFAFAVAGLWMVLRGDVNPGEPIDPETLAPTAEEGWVQVLVTGAITAVALLCCWWIGRRLKNPR